MFVYRRVPVGLPSILPPVVGELLRSTLVTMVQLTGVLPWIAPRQLTADLKDAINVYLNGKSGQVDVPVRFYVSPFHNITLNDYQATSTSTLDLIADTLGVGSTVQASRLHYNEGDIVPVQAMLRNSSGADSGPVTAAFFANAPGWGDWYIGSAFITDLPADGSVQVGAQWNTTGFGGDVLVKVVINPYGRVGETNFTNNSKSVTISITPNQVDQVITFPEIPAKTLSNVSFDIMATASSGLTVSFTSLTTTICAVAGSTVTPINVGECVIQATQAGNLFYRAAPAVQFAFLIKDPTRQDQSITFATLTDRTYVDSPFTLTATASSGLPVTPGIVDA